MKTHVTARLASASILEQQMAPLIHRNRRQDEQWDYGSTLKPYHLA